MQPAQLDSREIQFRTAAAQTTGPPARFRSEAAITSGIRGKDSTFRKADVRKVEVPNNALPKVSQSPGHFLVEQHAKVTHCQMIQAVS